MAEKRQTSKIFVGGLSWETTDQRLRTYFENYGAVSEAFVSFDRTTGRPRGFGFVVFEDPAVADKVVSLQHTIDRRDVEAKKAVPKEEHPAGKPLNGLSSQRTKKIFVGGLAPSVDEHAFRKYFEQYGAVEDAVVMYDHDNKRPRGFGFVTFASEEGVDAVFTGGSLQSLHDKPIEIKRAVPRDQIASARGRPTYMQQPRLFTGSQSARPLPEPAARSGFASAAMGPAFGNDNPPLHGSLLSSHSLGNPNSSSQVSSLTEAFSLGAAGLPAFSHDLGALSQGLTAGLLNAMSSQLSGQLSVPVQNNGLQNNGLQNLGTPAGSLHRALPQQPTGSQLQSLGSTHLQDLLRPGAALGQPALQLQGLGSSQLAALGSSHLATGTSGLLQGSYDHSAPDNLSADFAAPVAHVRPHDATAAFHQPASRLETAFGAMALEPQASYGPELPAPNGFEERVNMLSAGSAGLGQLPSPAIPPHFIGTDHGSTGLPRDVVVSSQQW